MNTRNRTSAGSASKLLRIASSPLWLSFLLAFPSAYATDAEVRPVQAKLPAHRLVKPYAAHEAANARPADKSSINPQPLPPFPAKSTGTAPSARPTWAAPTLTPEGIVAYGQTRTPSIDRQLQSKMNTSAKANTGASHTSVGARANWSAGSGQTNSNAELDMIRLQQLSSQRQQAVQATTDLQKGMKSPCPPKCPH